MFELPIGKAIVAVEAEIPQSSPGSKYVGDKGHKSKCDACYFDQFYSPLYESVCHKFPCRKECRQDGKDIVFKLIDHPTP